MNIARMSCVNHSTFQAQAAALLVLLMFVLASGTSARNIHGREDGEMNEEAFEGDIILTQRQKDEMAEEPKKGSIFTILRWPDHTTGDVTIPFRFFNGDISRADVMKGIDAWQAATCIKFSEVGESYEGNHLIFRKASACTSYIGRIPKLTEGQGIRLTPECAADENKVIHEIGHALGLYHEQSRTDRDKYVKVVLENIIPGKEANFKIGRTEQFGIPYDYSSIMQYSSTEFSVNGKYTLVSLDPTTQFLMDQKDGISFMDKKIVNVMYNCKKSYCPTREMPMSRAICLNNAYVGPGCTCICPPGTSGTNCENVDTPYTQWLVQQQHPGSELIEEGRDVASPNFPTPVDGEFIKALKAEPCVKISYTVNEFDMGDSDACTSYLEVKTSLLQMTGTKYCGTDLAAGTVITSRSGYLILNAKIVNDGSSSLKGFTGTAAFTVIEGCDPDNPTTTVAPTTTTIAATTLAPPPKVTFVNSGDIPVSVNTDADGSGACTYDQSTNSFESANHNTGGRYRKGDNCNAWSSTSEPRYLVITAEKVKIPKKEKLLINYTYKKYFRLKNKNTGDSRTLPTAAANIIFKTVVKSGGNGFKLSLQVMNSECHQLVIVEAGASAEINIRNYKPGTVCEYWFQTPDGFGLEMDFSRFNVGRNNCKDDYLLLDKRGDPHYKEATSKHCGGKKTPGVVRSETNRASILLNGINSRKNSGFTVKFTTFPLIQSNA